MIERRLLTAAIVAAAETTNIPIGLAHAADGGGWQGQPNLDSSDFVPYGVITPNTATSAMGPFSDPQADRQIPYSIASFGVKAEQVEWVADKLRAAVGDLKKTVVSLGDRDYTIQQVRADVLGGLQRVDQTEPPYWGQVDVVTLWLTPA